MKLLLIEDNKDMLDLMLLQLRDRWEVVTAADGSDALKAIADSLKGQKFDVIVLDVAMMYMDGLSFVRAMRCWEEHDIYPGMRILLHTAHDDLVMSGQVLKRLRLKKDDLFLKPMDTPKLLKVLEV